MDLVLLRQPAGHIHVEDSLKLFCNISINIQVPNITSNNINVGVVWTKISIDHMHGSIDIASNDRFNIIYEEIKSDSLYLYSSILLINSLVISDSARYNCTATISPYPNSLNLFNITKQSSTIEVLLSKC